MPGMVKWWNGYCGALVDCYRRLMALSKKNKREIAGRTYRLLEIES
jgi:hypothetical protein